jgi:hypothetical protein
LYGEEVPEEVQAMLNARGVDLRLQNTCASPHQHGRLMLRLLARLPLHCIHRITFPASSWPPPTCAHSFALAYVDRSRLDARLARSLLMLLLLLRVVPCSNIKWLRFKVQMLAFFANRLRSQLLKEREKSAGLELQLARLEAEALQEAVDREAAISEELLGNLRGQLER